MRRFYGTSGVRWNSAAMSAGLALLLIAAEPASAAIEIAGHSNSLELRLQNASIGDVLAALAARFKLTYRAPPNLMRELSGRYSGSLNQVLVRILDDVDYVVEASHDGVRLVILNPADKAKNTPPGTPDNRSGSTPAPLASAGRQGLPAQASPLQTNSLQATQAAATRASAAQVRPNSPASSSPLVIPGDASAAAVPPLTSFLPTTSPERLP